MSDFVFEVLFLNTQFIKAILDLSSDYPLCFLFYLIPSAIAFVLKKHNLRSIFVCNLFLGFTGITTWFTILIWVFLEPQNVPFIIDFTAHNEMELAAIKLSVEQVRVESGNDEIRVQAIEEKDGFIVVKVAVPKTEDKILKHEYETKIQGLMAEKYTQIGKIEALKEELEKQRRDLLVAIKDGRTIHTTNYIEGSVSGGNVAGNDMVISTEAQTRRI